MSNDVSKSGCKEILFWKFIYAIICCILSQITFLVLFLLVLNFSALNPLVWVTVTVSYITSLNTWLLLIPLASIIFAQGIIYSKDYVFEAPYRTSRMSKYLSVFTLRNLLSLITHVLIGVLTVWLYLTLLGGEHSLLYRTCREVHACVVEETLLLFLNGIWIGVFYFIKEYLQNEKKILFPVIQQQKLLAVKLTVGRALKQAVAEAFWPTVYFLVIYYFRALRSREWFSEYLGIQFENEPLTLFGMLRAGFVHAWLFSSMFIFSILCMKLFLELFLTEQWAFRIEEDDTDRLTLKEALTKRNLPIVQYLACFDLYRLSVWDPVRRQQLFSLSQPGGHPHNWNRLLEVILNVITEFSGELSKAMDAVLMPTSIIKPKETAPEVEDVSPTGNEPNVSGTPTSVIGSPAHLIGNPSNLIASPEKLLGSGTSLIESPKYVPPGLTLSPEAKALRNMSLVYYAPSNITLVPEEHTPTFADKLKLIIQSKAEETLTVVKRKSGYDYLFGEVPETRLYYLLLKCQPIIWAIQGLSFISTASFIEDSYGVVQKDLPVIITTLVQLKQSVDKLNKVSLGTRKTSRNEIIKMQLKTALRTAIRRSLYNLCNTFGEYLSQIPLNKDISAQMQSFILYKEG